MSKLEKELKKLEIGAKPDELDYDSIHLLNQCLAAVFKEYLPHISDSYSVIDFENDRVSKGSPAESVASFDITKLVLEKNDKIIEKLKNVYHLLAYSNNSIALIINRKYQTVRLTVAVGLDHDNSEEVINLARSVRDAMIGNFPGSECSNVVNYSAQNKGAFLPLNRQANFSASSFNSVGIVSNIATDFSDEFANQGIEKLIDGIRLKENQEYTLILLGKALNSDILEEKKDELYRFYTALSPYAKRTKNWGKNEGKNWSTNLSLSLFGNIGKQALPNIPFMQNGFPMSGNLGGSIGGSHSWGRSIGVTEGESVEIVQYGISHTLEIINQQMKRLEQCEALGLWSFAGYVFSKDINLVSEVSHMYMSLTQGKESYYEKPSINIWNANNTNSERNTRTEILKIREYVSHLQHPGFMIGENKEWKYRNEANWPYVVSCTTDVSGAELARALNLPRESVPGVAVIECAPFGREISSYDSAMLGNVTIGKIHHMHHDEETPVRLTADSLTSHVFVTGSTGAGKSNTVYTLLSNANTDFLVIEPTKGEYKYAFGDEVNKFGTNYRMGEMLKVNPFEFPDEIHVYEHIDRLLEVFNVCWPMYAAMPSVLKDAIIRAYEKVGWDTRSSINVNGKLFPTFADVCDEIDNVIESSDYSDENKGNYRGSLKTRLHSLTNGINGLIFCEGSIPDEILFDSKTIIDLSRVGSAENKSLIMGIMVIKLQEHRMCQRQSEMNEGLKHITVLEEAHHLLRANASSSSPEMGGGLGAKSVEMLANAIAEMRTYGESFVIVDQAPGLLDMSVIRNTNTKIIMRLPDQSDRELVGRAANLNEDQIQELAKLQRGVAAIYQNEWIEPVLCHVVKYAKKRSLKAIREYMEEIADKNSALTEKEIKYVNTCIYDLNYLPRQSDISFIDCVEKLAVDSSLKALLYDYGRSPASRRLQLYPEVCYRYFGIQKFLEKEDFDNVEKIGEGLINYLETKYQFSDSVDFSLPTKMRDVFIRVMLLKFMTDAAKVRTAENIEKIEKLNTLVDNMKVR